MRVKKNKGQQVGDRLKQAEHKLKLLLERAGNLEAWALETMRGNKERENLVQMMATCVTLLIKDCIGRGLSEEETAALTEALDGPKKGETDGETSQSAEGNTAPAAGTDVHDKPGQVG